MEAIAIWLLVLGYAFGACLMLAFWSRIPPPQFFQDLLFALWWPALLVIMLLSGFVDSLVRALRDKDGTVGGLIKDGKWYRYQQERKAVKEEVRSP